MEINDIKLENDGSDEYFRQLVNKGKMGKVVEYINQHFAFRYNEVCHQLEFHNGISEDYIFFSDREFSSLFAELKLAGFNVSQSLLDSLVKSKFFARSYDPFKHYLLGLKKWDGITDYISMLLKQIKLKNEAERPVLERDFKKWFVALVASLITEKVVNQHCFVLVGPQGQYKTTWLNNLVPDVLKLDYLYSSKFIFEKKDHYKYLATKMLINLDELATLNRTDVGILKSVLTEDRVIMRMPYARHDVHMWRRASFCGSTNNDEFLMDETGNRRFLIHSIATIEPEETDINLCYAQALALYKEGFQYWYDREQIKELDERNTEYHDNSIEQDLIQEYLELPRPVDIEMDYCRYESTTAINIYLAGKSNKINVNESTKKRCGQVLKKLGYKKPNRWIDGKSIKLWAIKYKDPNNIAPVI